MFRICTRFRLGWLGRALSWAALWLCVGCAQPSGFVVAGPASLPEYPGSAATSIVPMLVTNLDFDGVKFELEGPEARIDLWPHPRWQAGPTVGITMPRDDDIDSMVVAQLPEVDLAVEVGAFVGYEHPVGLFEEDSLQTRLAFRHDVTDAHGGALLTAETEYFFVAARMLRFGTAVSATYATDDYMDTYYSVDAVGATRSGLPLHSAGAGLAGIGAEVYSILSFNEEWGLFSRVGYDRLLGDAADSPIVDLEGSADQWFVGAGVFWRF